MKESINESLTRLSEELADAMPRRGFIRRFGAFVAAFTVLGAIQRAFGAQGYDLGSPVISLTRTAGGSGYTNGTQALAFAGGGGTGATGTATVAGGIVTSVSLTAGGNGYTSAPAVSVAGGTGAVITANFTPCTITGGECSNTGSECGSAGYKCIGVVKGSTDKSDPCCNCKDANNAACPPPLVTGAQSWMACCLCAEHETAKIGRVYTYRDCCQKDGMTYPSDCPEECYHRSSEPYCPAHVAVVDCVQISNRDWCDTAGKNLCTLPGTATGQFCKWS